MGWLSFGSRFSSFCRITLDVYSFIIASCREAREHSEQTAHHRYTRSQVEAKSLDPIISHQYVYPVPSLGSKPFKPSRGLTRMLAESASYRIHNYSSSHQYSGLGPFLCRILAEPGSVMVPDTRPFSTLLFTQCSH